MKKLFFTLALIVLYYNVSICGDMKFIILTANGSITLTRNSNATVAKVGEKIFDNDKLKVGKKSYLNLAYQDGKTLEIKSAGSYNTSKLITMVNSKKNSSAKKFSSYVLAQFVKSVDDLGDMKVTGSVERAVKPSIDYGTPYNTNILDPVVTLCWYPVSGNSYTVKLTDVSGNVLYSKQLSDTSITLNLQELNLSRDKSYKWSIKNNKKEKAITDTSKFHWLAQGTADSIKKSAGKLLKDIDKLDHSIKQTLLASFYSDNKLYIDMLEAYQRAIVLSPDNKTIKLLYYNALNKTGLTRTASSIKNQLN